MPSINSSQDAVVARLPVSELRMKLRLRPRLAPSSSFAPPDQETLSHRIVEGKRELDRITDNALSGVSAACRDALPAEALDDGQFAIQQRGPLPLPTELSHRALDGRHLWIGVEDGIAITLDPDEHALFLGLRDGLSPTDVVEATSTISADLARTRVNNLIGRLALSGFIRGVHGMTDRWVPNARRFMRLHLTQRCNLTCVHCYSDSSPFVSGEGEISEERWTQLIDDFADAGGERVLFTGGEALVFKGCDHLIRKAKSRDLEVTLFSNGLLVDRHLDVIRECVDQVQISIDGPDAETNDLIRGAGSFKRAKEAVDLLVAAGVKVRISMVVMQANIEQMKRGFVQFASQWPRGAVGWRLGYGVAYHGRGEELGDPLGIADVRPIVDSLLEAVEGPSEPLIARSTKGCGYAEQVVVAPDGSVHPCHLLDGAVAHIDDQPMEALLSILSKTSHEFDVDHTVGCRACDIRNLCGGGCRILNGKTTGNRRVTNCTAEDKLHRLQNLAEVFSEDQIPQPLAGDWE